MTTTNTATRPEAIARKTLKPLGVLVVGMFTLIGFASCVNSEASAPAPTVTVTAAPEPASTVTVTAAPKATAAPTDSDALALLKNTYRQMSASDRKAFQAAWAAADGDPDLELLFAQSFAAEITAVPVTIDEVLEFLHWAAKQ